MKNFRSIIAGALLLCAISAYAQTSRIEHIEPNNWWVGMKNNNLQVMIHGKEIANNRVSIEYDGVSLNKTITVDNPNYLFLDLTIAPDAKAGLVPIKLTGNNKKVTTIQYELKSRASGSSERKGFTSEDAMYLIMPDRFANGDPTNDDIQGMLEKSNRNEPYGRHGGDLKGISQHLVYITGLGMTAIWLNPIQENNMPKSSYHGYAITDYSKIDARFGTNDDFKEFVAQCHANGLKVVMDMVFNHCGSNHWWMKDLPCRDWVNMSQDNHTISNYRLSTVSDPHAADVDRDLATRAWFDHTMPDMNLSNPLVRDYFIQNSIWWIENFGIDGIRQDTYPYPDKYAMAEWNRRVTEEYPLFNIVGETWISSTAKVAYWQRDVNNKDGYNSHLAVTMDFPLRDALCSALNEESGWSTGLQRIYDVLAEDYLYADPLNVLVFGENHDCGRLLHTVGGDIDKLKMATIFLATTRGIPQLYVGTEALMTGDGSRHCDIRTDFPGGWQGDSISYFTDMPSAQQDMYDFTAQIFKFRKSSEALQKGTLTHYVPQNDVYVYFREYGKERIMILMNNTSDSQTIDCQRFEQNLKGTRQGIDVMSNQHVNLENLSIKGRSALVIKL
ncbi:MAG: glycoside hydrolase family 13 protein [Marinilabiliaceae bacterium]|nr:glycoside hydrolase family 13 protein [Marinilabiliaceae bacterium]